MSFRTPSPRTRPLARVLAVALAGALLFGCVADNSNDLPAGPSFRAAQAQDAIGHAIDVQNRNTERLMSLEGVVGTAVGLGSDGKPAVLVLTKAPGLSGIPASVEGVRVETRLTGEIFAGRPGGGGSSLKSRQRPVPNGVSVSNNNECAAGTLGAAVLSGGAEFALSNNHVFARENAASVGEPIVQPGRYDNKPKCANNLDTDMIGTLADFEPIDFSANGNNVMDAAIAAATTDLTCSTPAAFYGSPSAITAAAALGMAIQKVGRTSSLTTGTVTMINATVTVGYPNGSARFVNQFVTSGGFSKSGDSGSLIVTNDGTKRPVGLLFAGTNDGTTIGNLIDPILNRFNVSICSI